MQNTTEQAKQAVTSRVDSKIFWTGIAVVVVVGAAVYGLNKAGFKTPAKILSGGK